MNLNTVESFSTSSTVRTERDSHLQENFFRGPGEDLSGQYKEWVHFCIFGEALQIIVNLHIHWRKSKACSEVSPHTTVTVLIRRPESGWMGDVETYPASELEYKPGSISLQIGPNSFTYSEGAYRLACDLDRLGLQLNCSLQPRCLPFSANSVLLDGDRSLRWCTVPTLEALGSLIQNTKVTQIKGLPAYHDHNWGRFLWGGNYAWEWASLVTSDAQSNIAIVYSRLTDGGRHKVLSQSLLIWKDGKFWKRFVNAAFTVQQTGFLEQRKPLRVPPILGMGASGTVFDLPSHILIMAKDTTLSLSLNFHLIDRAEIAVPTESGRSGLSILSEVHAHGNLAITGREISMQCSCPAIVEFNRAVQ